MRIVNVSVTDIDVSDLEGVPPSVRGGCMTRQWVHKGCKIAEYNCTPNLYSVYFPGSGEVYLEGTPADANAMARKIGLIA